MSAAEDPMPTWERIETAVTGTLRGWGRELDDDRKFWWHDWNRMIRDTLTAARTGEVVYYPDDDEDDDQNGLPAT